MIWSICIILTALALDEPDVESAGPTADPTEYWEWYLDSWEESTLWQAWWEEGRECADEAHLSLQCLFSLSKCTCAEILDDAKGCNWYYNPTELFSPNDEECDIERVIFSIMWWSDGSDDYEDACSELVSVGETTGELPYSKCECFSLVPVETASAIFNCVYDGNSLLDTWETCAGANHSSSITFGMLPSEDCRLSCGHCTISPTAGPTNTEPTEELSSSVDSSDAERPECTDIAEYSDHCRYGSTMCTCSELLDSTECGEPYTSDETFHEITDDCDMHKLFDGIRAVASESEVMLASCEQLINTYNTQGTMNAEGCECIGQITEEDASVILNCQILGQSALTIWSGCSQTTFNLHQRTMVTDPSEICPVSCGLCEAREPAQANNWWVYLIIVVGVITLLAVIIVCLRGGITSRTTAKEGVATAAEMCTRKDHADFGEKEGEP